jgi:hypothetical protein
MGCRPAHSGPGWVAPELHFARSHFFICHGWAGVRGLAGTAPDDVGLPEFGGVKGAPNGFRPEFYVLASPVSSSDRPARCRPTRAPRQASERGRSDRANYMRDCLVTDSRGSLIGFQVVLDLERLLIWRGGEWEVLPPPAPSCEEGETRRILARSVALVPA